MSEFSKPAAVAPAAKTAAPIQRPAPSGDRLPKHIADFKQAWTYDLELVQLEVKREIEKVRYELR